MLINGLTLALLKVVQRRLEPKILTAVHEVINVLWVIEHVQSCFMWDVFYHNIISLAVFTFSNNKFYHSGTSKFTSNSDFP